MAIQNLSEEQIRDWTPEQKDRWWLENVYRGNMPQLTLRSALTGFVLGGLLSATNLYIGAKTGWTLGVGLTSVILAFAMFKVLSQLGAKDMTILENNAMQSIATSAGYMTGPLVSGLAAYMMVKNATIPWWQMLLFNVVLSILGVLVAFPMKRRFINDEQQPFPEGRACGVLLDTLYTSAAELGLFKARALAFAALFAGTIKFMTGEYYHTFIQDRLLGLSKVRWLSEHPFERLLDWTGLDMPTIANISLKKLDLSPTINLEMLGAGGLMNIRYAANMFAGMIVMWACTMPFIVGAGDTSNSKG
ncbi:MAG: OPT/YSL family transporter, partial [Phycisphaerales bacterium]